MSVSNQFPAYAAAYAAAHASIRHPTRLAAVRATGLLDSEPEEAFDRLTRLAVRLVGVPGAFVSLVDVDRDFYLSACGAGAAIESRRELTGPTFCHFTVYRAEPLIIDDTAADPVYSAVPTVRSLGVAAYVGIPLVVDGQTIGAFCAIDTRPHAWSSGEVEVLAELAVSAQREIELRIARERAERMAARLDERATGLALEVEELRVRSRTTQALNAQLEALVERLRQGPPPAT